MEITDEEVKSLAQSILTRYGIDFTCYEPKSLRRRITKLMVNQEIESAHHLWVKFLRDSKFIQFFMNEVSVGMTSMFRDPTMWKSLKGILRTEFTKKDSMSIWHAGCSTGEEVYSMSILLKELHREGSVRAIATDINLEAIRTAQEGVYHKLKMIENEANFKEYNAFADFKKYYSEDSKNGIMDSALISSVEFSYHNLITDAPPAPGMFDIIFCRNVMIYFDNYAKERLLEKFFTALRPGGLFIIGFYDTMLPIVRQHQFVMADEAAKIFRKPSPDSSDEIQRIAV